MTAAIRVENLTKTYKKFNRGAIKAIDDVSFEIPQGEVFGFVGPNGAGKSTTIKILTGAIRPSSGRGTMFGRDLASPESRVGLGYVPENPQLHDYLTPLETLRMGLRLHRVKLDNEKAHCMQWLERFELAQVANKQIRSFSKGMTQRVALAHALAIKPRLLILDEPLSGLDPLGRRDVVNILAEFKREGGTIFFTSHVLHDVERLADRFGLIHKGRLMTLSSLSDLVGGKHTYTIRSSGDAVLPEMIAEVAGRWSIAVDAEQLWPRLEQLKSAGHQLIEVKPSLSLESAFLHYLGLDIVEQNKAA